MSEIKLADNFEQTQDIKLADNFEQTQDDDDDFTVSCYVCKHSTVEFNEHPCRNCCRNHNGWLLNMIG